MRALMLLLDLVVDVDALVFSVVVISGSSVAGCSVVGCSVVGFSVSGLEHMVHHKSLQALSNHFPLFGFVFICMQS